MSLIPLGGTIKSIQRGVINLLNTETSKTAIITSVTVGKSIINHVGYTKATYHCSLSLTNATTVTAYANDSGDDLRKVSFEIIEFN